MNGEDPRTRGSTSRSGDGRSPTGHVFVSYAHDPAGIRVAKAICLLLRRACVDVVSDHGLSVLSPPSIQAWMDDKIANGIVILILSRGYLHAFDEERPGIKAHRGVRYELRAVRQKIYDHIGSASLPVIPVAMPDFIADDVPPTLRGLAVERFDPETGNGGDLIVQRVKALQGSVEGGAAMWGGRSFAQIFQELQATDPMSGRAVELVTEALSRPATVEILRGFDVMEKAVKFEGDASLMRKLVDECLRLLYTSQDLLPGDCDLEPGFRIRGKVWVLRREHSLQEALEEVQRAVRMAECRADQRRTLALAKKVRGEIAREVAEESVGHAREFYFDDSIKDLTEAAALFEAIDGDCLPASEVGVCLLLQARTQLSRYRVLHDRTALVQAAQLAEQADRLVSSSHQVKEYYELTVLQAEIAAANRRCASGTRLLNKVIEDLIAMPGAAYAEVLAQAYVARSGIALSMRAAKATVIGDLRKAHHIYRTHNLGHAMAATRWSMVKLDPREVRHLKITQTDIKELERVTTDPRLRFAAIDDVKRDLDARLGRHSGKQIDWEHRVKRVRHRDWSENGRI